MQWLHRCDHAQLAETRDVAILDQLDVLDAVMNPGSVPGRLVGVERRLHAAVANRMGDALETCPGEERDGF